ncbi:MAG: LPS-assembly protein LptD [Gammaproteobacteria bacterium]
MLIFTEVTSADNAAWNCEQAKNGEWTCLNPPETGQKPAESRVIKTEASPPVDTTQSAATEKPLEAPATISGKLPEPAKAEAAQRAEKQQKLHARIGESQKPVIETIPAPESTPKQNIQTAKRQGWTCKSGEENDSWNCNLVGPDPKGKAQAIAESEQAASSWLSPTYSRQQERMFQVLREEFDRDPWESCSDWSTKKRKIIPTPNEVRNQAPTDVTADFSEVFDGEILNFAGNVDLTRADQHLMADKASYDTVADTMDAQGNVIYSEDILALSSDTASLSLGKDEARLRQAQFIAAEGPLRGTAEVMYRDSKILSRYHEATFTSCPPNNQDWVAHASRVKINRETGKGSAKNAWLEFKGVPFLYTPYISFPIDNRRTTGILAPNFGNTDRNGFDVSVPVYWNIAPNYDTVITPRYMERRGPMLRNKFRYLTETSKGTIGAEILPYDELKEKTRYSGYLKDVTQFTSDLSSNIDLNYVSDKEYFNDLNNALGFQRNRYLPSKAYLNYSGLPKTDFSVGIHHFQSVDKTIPDSLMPYDILPRVNLNLNHDFEDLPIALAMENQFSQFYHDTKVNGQRLNIAPSVSVPLESSAGFFIPKITGQYTHYQLSNLTDPNQKSAISRMLPIFSIDTGLMFDKEITLGGSEYIHTLEPRLFYLYIPRTDQSDIPLFDTTAYDTNYYSLFRENRYSGMDRIQDANQITLAATSSLIDNTTGLEPVRLSFGQIIYFQNRTVDLDYLNNNRPAETTTTSNFVGELSGQMTPHLSYMGGMQWDPIANGFNRMQAMLKYRNQPDQIFDVGYRYRRKTPSDQSALAQYSISQSDASFRWPLAAGWYGLGRWQYSFNFGRTTESFIGIEKETCCWRFRIIGRRYINGATTTNFLAPDAKAENAVFVQLELKGLTSFGNQIDQFLKRNLNGYQPASYFDD